MHEYIIKRCVIVTQFRFKPLRGISNGYLAQVHDCDRSQSASALFHVVVVRNIVVPYRLRSRSTCPTPRCAQRSARPSALPEQHAGGKWTELPQPSVIPPNTLAPLPAALPCRVKAIARSNARLFVMVV